MIQKYIYKTFTNFKKALFSKNFAKTTLILISIFMLGWFLPSGAVDQWNIFNPKKIIYMIFALAFVQAVGALMIQLLGARVGAIVSGFLGGLVSSTATTAALARKSKLNLENQLSIELLTFLSATLAMLFEGIALIIFGTNEFHINLLIVFLGPVLVIYFFIRKSTKNSAGEHVLLKPAKLEILPLFKLSLFIFGVLSLSKILQSLFGKSGLIILTFLVSLFEIHGSLIANIQLHDAGAYKVELLGGLVAVSVCASMISKYFLVYTLGSAELRKQVSHFTTYLFLSLVASWVIFILVV
ncbi:MAG: DUF4010 domain-containing protein [Bdellovibrionales bacterium]